MRAVHRNADATAHHDAIDQRDIGLAEILDRHIERIFVAPELQRLVAPAGLAEIVEMTNVAAGRKCTLAGGLNRHPRDGRIVRPIVELRAQCQHHGMGDGIERLRPVERDDAGGTPALD